MNFEVKYLLEKYIPLSIDFQINNPSKESSIYISSLKIVSPGELIARSTDENLDIKFDKTGYVKNENIIKEMMWLVNEDKRIAQQRINKEKQQFFSKIEDSIEQKLAAEIKSKSSNKTDKKISKEINSALELVLNQEWKIHNDNLKRERRKSARMILPGEEYLSDPYHMPTAKEQISSYTKALRDYPPYYDSYKTILLGVYTKSNNAAFLNLRETKPEIKPGSIGFYSFTFLLSKKIMEFPLSIKQEEPLLKTAKESKVARSLTADVSIFRKGSEDGYMSENEIEELSRRFQVLNYYLEVMISDQESGNLLKTAATFQTL